MSELRGRLPDDDAAVGAVASAPWADRVVVREGGSRWRAESGQYVLEFEGDPAEGSLERDRAHRPARTPQPSARRMVRARDRRSSGTDAEARAVDAYERAIAADPAFLDAHINLGRLLHETRRFAERGARLPGGDQALRQRSRPALQPRRAARRPGAPVGRGGRVRSGARERSRLRRLSLQPGARCTKSSREPKEALRHMARYRALIGSGPK